MKIMKKLLFLFLALSLNNASAVQPEAQQSAKEHVQVHETKILQTMRNLKLEPQVIDTFIKLIKKRASGEKLTIEEETLYKTYIVNTQTIWQKALVDTDALDSGKLARFKQFVHKNKALLIKIAAGLGISVVALLVILCIHKKLIDKKVIKKFEKCMTIDSQTCTDNEMTRLGDECKRRNIETACLKAATGE